MFKPNPDGLLLLPIQNTLKDQTLHRCVEIGTGSGYIICSLALIFKQRGIHAHCFGIDLNPLACLCTQQTLTNHEAR